MRKKYFLGLAALCAFLFLALNAEAARQTRDLVFEEEEDVPAAAEEVKIPDAQVVAVKATIELKRNGQVSTVSPSHEFKSGDRVKLVYTPNIDGYAYWMAKGSSGALTVLFPSVQAGVDNKVTRNTEYTVPVKGTFKFDDTPGKEELLCVISPERIPELDKIIAENSKGVIPAENAVQKTYPGSEVVMENAVQIAEVEKKNTSRRQTRDLVFEEEEEEEISTKTQVAPRGEPFVAYYVLNHK